MEEAEPMFLIIRVRWINSDKVGGVTINRVIIKRFAEIISANLVIIVGVNFGLKPLNITA